MRKFTYKKLASSLTAGALTLVLLTGCQNPQEINESAETANSSSTETSEVENTVVHAELTDNHIHPITDSPNPQLPATVTSYSGETVTVTDVSRIIAVDLYGTLAETVFSLGLGDNVVGKDVSTGFDEAADVPMVTSGGSHTLSAEAILNLNPTVILTDSSIGPPEVLRQMADAGIPVIYFDPTRSLDGMGEQIMQVAAALGVEAEGKALAERVEQEISDFENSVTTSEQPRIAFLYMRGTSVALLGGPKSGADDLIHAVGGIDAGTDIGLDRPFTQITSEALIAASPDIILLMAGGLKSVNGLEGLLKIPAISSTPAGQNQRVIVMPDTQVLSFGPRTAQVLEALHEAVTEVSAR